MPFIPLCDEIAKPFVIRTVQFDLHSTYALLDGAATETMDPVGAVTDSCNDRLPSVKTTIVCSQRVAAPHIVYPISHWVGHPVETLFQVQSDAYGIVWLLRYSDL